MTDPDTRPDGTYLTRINNPDGGNRYEIVMKEQGKWFLFGISRELTTFQSEIIAGPLDLPNLARDLAHAKALSASHAALLEQAQRALAGEDSYLRLAIKQAEKLEARAAKERAK